MRHAAGMLPGMQQMADDFIYAAAVLDLGKDEWAPPRIRRVSASITFRSGITKARAAPTGIQRVRGRRLDRTMFNPVLPRRAQPD